LYSLDGDRHADLNVNGGSIAIGYPLCSTGADAHRPAPRAGALAVALRPAGHLRHRKCRVTERQ